MAADVLGLSGQLMLKALIAREGDGVRLPGLAEGPLHKKREGLASAAQTLLVLFHPVEAIL